MEAALQAALHGEQRFWRASECSERSYCFNFSVLTFEGVSLAETIKVVSTPVGFQGLLKVSGHNKGLMLI